MPLSREKDLLLSARSDLRTTCSGTEECLSAIIAEPLLFGGEFL